MPKDHHQGGLERASAWDPLHEGAFSPVKRGEGLQGAGKTGATYVKEKLHQGVGRKFPIVFDDFVLLEHVDAVFLSQPCGVGQRVVTQRLCLDL